MLVKLNFKTIFNTGCHYFRGLRISFGPEKLLVPAVLTKLHHTGTIENSQSGAAHRIRDVENASDVERGVCAVVQRVAGLVVGLSNVSVEFLMLPVADPFRLHHPQGLMKQRSNNMFMNRSNNSVISLNFKPPIAIQYHVI